ncbi:MAG: porin family protein [Alphaproteobacteria bacterium]|nr:porin family protein [Alphaproteobacteria bacterium]
MQKLSLSVLALLAGLPQAFAADAKAPLRTPPAETYHWNGLYTGVSVGAGQSRFGWYSEPSFTGLVLGGTTNPTFTTTPFSLGLKSTKAIAGLHIGYNWTSEPLVYGLEADWQTGSYRTGNFIPLPPPAPNMTAFAINGTSTDLLGAKVNYTASLSARLGLIALPRLMIYATGGLALANLTAQGSYVARTGIGTPAASYSQSTLMTGWSAGFGADYALSQNWTLGADYRYADYGHKSVQLGSLTNNPSGRTWAINNVIRLTNSATMIRLSYRF